MTVSWVNVARSLVKVKEVGMGLFIWLLLVLLLFMVLCMVCAVRVGGLRGGVCSMWL